MFLCNSLMRFNSRIAPRSFRWDKRNWETRRAKPQQQTQAKKKKEEEEEEDTYGRQAADA